MLFWNHDILQANALERALRTWTSKSRLSMCRMRAVIFPSWGSFFLDKFEMHTQGQLRGHPTQHLMLADPWLGVMLSCPLLKCFIFYCRLSPTNYAVDPMCIKFSAWRLLHKNHKILISSLSSPYYPPDQIMKFKLVGSLLLSSRTTSWPAVLSKSPYHHVPQEGLYLVVGNENILIYKD